MEQETQKQKNYLLPASIFASAVLIVAAWIYTAGLKASGKPLPEKESAAEVPAQTVSPQKSVTIPVRWGDLGARMVAAGVIDGAKFEAMYGARGGLSEADKKLLEGVANGNLVMTSTNSGFLLNLLWALGLGNKNEILEQGPMQDPRYGGAGRFASTGGWVLAQGDPMNHYSRHAFITLTPEQQQLVEQVAKNIYRPCCDNATHFPDCNHGMAMLGLLELMASQGATEAEIYRTALAVNTLWFPEQYATIGAYLTQRGVGPTQTSPKEILGMNFSSISGYQRVMSEVEALPRQGGGSCGA